MNDDNEDLKRWIILIGGIMIVLPICLAMWIVFIKWAVAL